ncbi:MAG: hypothetical protein LBN99_07625 [Oscillospiraceae bacterium]|nr:hypothetical protein [Oscillospiraceae bacterium]
MFTKLKLRIPFLHYRPELPELLQAVLMVAVGFSAAPVLQEYLGLSYGAALTAVAIAEALGLLHSLFSDPVVPGWIASALSLVLSYLGAYSVGLESIHAMIALQLLVSVIFIVLGATGLAHKLMRVIPNSLKAGILLGAAVAAIGRVFGDSGYFSKYPLSIGSGTVVALFVLFSTMFKNMKEKWRAFREIGKYGMLSSIIVAMLVGFVSGEIQLPRVEWGFIPFSFGELFRNASVFSIGLPPLKMFLTALPTAIAVYIIAFGEIITEEAVIKECREARPEEPLSFSSNRSNVIAGIRNLILALVAPFTGLAGPLWAAVTVSIGERYKEGRSSMKSLLGGVGSFKLSTAVCVLFLPLASFLGPVLPVALACTLVVQGFACSYIAIEQVKDNKVSAGIAGLTGAVVYFADMNWGLLVGVAGYLLMEGGLQSIIARAVKRESPEKKLKKIG